jgi:hydroxymethylpyrimidine kinase/phosphomethylpyrimidine kinase
MNTPNKIAGRPVVLTIAGLDPSGGAGVIADIRTIAAFDCLCTAAITSLTFQNNEQVWGAEHVSPATLRAQVMAVVQQQPVSAVKTGMLPTRELVSETARLVREASLPAPVIDPVMRSTSGYSLVDAGTLEAMVAELLPLARIITPNIPEAEHLTGMRIIDEADMRLAAGAIRGLGARAVLIKGGHLPKSRPVTDNKSSSSLGPRATRPPDPKRPDQVKPTTVVQPVIDSIKEAGGTPAVPVREAIDVLDDDGEVTVFREPWIAGVNVRGTGCTLSAAIAAGLAKKLDLQVAVAEARDFVRLAISRANSR